MVIGLYEKKTGIAAEDLPDVMAKVKSTGRYEYDHLGKLSIAALLPLLFGGSVGPEAGKAGVIAGLCTWVGDRMETFWLRFSRVNGFRLSSGAHGAVHGPSIRFCSSSFE